MKYVWAFVAFVVLIIMGIVSIVGELLEFVFGIALTGVGLLAAVGLWIYIKVDIATAEAESLKISCNG